MTQTASITKGGEEASASSLGFELPERRDLFDSEEVSEAMAKVHALVCVRERTEKEVLNRLLEAGFDHETAYKASGRAVECGLVSDDRYAAAYISGKTHSGWGKQKIIQGLIDNGVSSQIIEKHSDLFSSAEEEMNQALKLCAKYSTHSKNPRATLLRRLVSKGFSYELSSRAVDEFMSMAAE